MPLVVQTSANEWRLVFKTDDVEVEEVVLRLTGVLVDMNLPPCKESTIDILFTPLGAYKTTPYPYIEYPYISLIYLYLHSSYLAFTILTVIDIQLPTGES